MCKISTRPNIKKKIQKTGEKEIHLNLLNWIKIKHSSSFNLGFFRQSWRNRNRHIQRKYWSTCSFHKHGSLLTQVDSPFKFWKVPSDKIHRHFQLYISHFFQPWSWFAQAGNSYAVQGCSGNLYFFFLTGPCSAAGSTGKNKLYRKAPGWLTRARGALNAEAALPLPRNSLPRSHLLPHQLCTTTNQLTDARRSHAGQPRKEVKGKLVRREGVSFSEL